MGGMELGQVREVAGFEEGGEHIKRSHEGGLFRIRANGPGSTYKTSWDPST